MAPVDDSAGSEGIQKHTFYYEHTASFVLEKLYVGRELLKSFLSLAGSSL